MKALIFVLSAYCLAGTASMVVRPAIVNVAPPAATWLDSLKNQDTMPPEMIELQFRIRMSEITLRELQGDVELGRTRKASSQQKITCCDFFSDAAQ